jgi:3-oxoacyl-[acyl-carrier-protein] synthase-3
MDELVAHLLDRLVQVRRALGWDSGDVPRPDTSFRDALDSMGLVEFLFVVAEECGTTPAVIEAAAGHRFGTVAELAMAMRAASIYPLRVCSAVAKTDGPHDGNSSPATAPTTFSIANDADVVWLAATAAHLPRERQPASVLNRALDRPAGWLEEHANIQERCVWLDEDPVEAAAASGRACLARARMKPKEVRLLLVTSEAPPLLAGLASALHTRLELHPNTVAFEIGGACTGYLRALWLARELAPKMEAALMIAVEAPSRYLSLQPGPAGEAAALFGDAAAATLVHRSQVGAGAVPLLDLLLGSDGDAGRLIRLERAPSGSVALRLEGRALASRALTCMTETVRELSRRNGIAVPNLAGIVAHGGNGRLPKLLARQLKLHEDSVWSSTPTTGNLGSASLPVAWSTAGRRPGPVAWTAVGAGLTWAGALTGSK